MSKSESWLNEVDEDLEVKAYELSGDEAVERSVLLSDGAAGKANFLLTVTTIMKTIIGGGILSLPYTVSRLGYVLALLITLLMLALNTFSSDLLLRAKNLSRHSNYSSIGYHLFRSKAFEVTLCLTIFLNNFGINILELMMVKGAIYRITNEHIPQYAIVLIMIGVLSPLLIVKRMERLKFMAFFGVSGITVFMITLVIAFFVHMKNSGQQIKIRAFPDPENVTEALAAIPNIILALAFQMNFYPIYKGMKN